MNRRAFLGLLAKGGVLVGAAAVAPALLTPDDDAWEPAAKRYWPGWSAPVSSRPMQLISSRLAETHHPGVGWVTERVDTWQIELTVPPTPAQSAAFGRHAIAKVTFPLQF